MMYVYVGVCVTLLCWFSLLLCFSVWYASGWCVLLLVDGVLSVVWFVVVVVVVLCCC